MAALGGGMIAAMARHPYDDEAFEGSWRQRRRRRRAQVVAIIVALAMLVPIVVTTLDAVSG